MAVKANQPVDATISVANAASGGADVCTIQLLGENGDALNGVGAVFFYIASTASGDTLAIDGTTTSDLAIATDGLLIEEVTDLAGWLVSESDGAIGLTVTVITAYTAYLVLVMPDGRLVISDVLTYT